MVMKNDLIWPEDRVELAIINSSDTFCIKCVKFCIKIYKPWLALCISAPVQNIVKGQKRLDGKY